MQKVKKKSINKKLLNELKNKTILVTGGAGSIGSAVVKRLLDYPVKAVRVLDIDEYGLFFLKRQINDLRLKPLLGNIFDRERVEMAGNGADVVIHSAAVKNIEISEFNPIETIDVNVNGTVNLIKMAMKNKPKKFLNISTDKAADASTLYGTTKKLSEILTTWAAIHIPTTKFASVRFGNVIESRGNVFDVWKREAEKGEPLSITTPNMKRYFFHSYDAINLILISLLQMKLGEIFVPKMKKYVLKDMALEYSNKHKIIGLRPGEKMEEILLTESEKKMAVEKKGMWIIKPYFIKNSEYLIRR